MESKSFGSASTQDLLKLAGRALSLEDPREAPCPAMIYSPNTATLFAYCNKVRAFAMLGRSLEKDSPPFKG